MLDFIRHVSNPDSNTDDIRDHFYHTITADLSAIQIADAVREIRSRATFSVDFPDSIDVCGTWWSPFKNRLNTSTLSAIKLSQQWISVVKSWNKSASWKMGSIDLLEKIGYELPEEKEAIEECYKESWLAFLYANALYPFLWRLAKLRKDYWKPTIFNIIWPLLSPGNPKAEIIGCSFENRMELMIEVCKELWKKRVMIVRWNDGLDEVTLGDYTQVFDLDNGKIRKYSITPEEFLYKKTQTPELSDEERIAVSKRIITWTENSSYSDLVDINVKVVRELLLK